MEDEPSSPQRQPSGSVPFHFVDEPEDTLLVILEEETAEPTLNLPLIPIEKLFA